MLRIALRNVFRNRRRTLLSVVLIALGTASLFVFKGYFDFIHWGMGLEAVAQYGHLQIADPTFWDKSAEGYEYLIDKEKLDRVVSLLKEEPDFKAYTVQLMMTGMIGTEKKSSVFMASGVEPESEIASLKYLLMDEGGKYLQPGEQNTVVLGIGLANQLGIRKEDLGPRDGFPGPPIVVMAATVGGQYNARNLFVIGLLETGQPEVDLRLAVVPLVFAQSILNTQSVENVIVELKNIEATESTKERLERRLQEADLNLQIKTWDDLAIFRKQTMAWFGAVYRFIGAAIFVLVFFSILEVMTMSFFERMREIGTIRAIGTKRSQVFGLFLSEGVLIGVIGGLVGLALGWGVGWLVNESDIRYEPPGYAIEVPLQIRLVWENTLGPFLIALFSTLVSTIYPALRAARIRVVEALRYV
ncbi:FtsX-like permease family protein [Candidatus Acetothermia bacterium]|jgi:putative ABC transport system permease protein|nr:FtsX-like permease family protein [Candidatus Acetothermia bacterium]MCI2431107.1 FtsX-like permease family protein [Candidatus Acetothermia bacterium]MCI2437085.1 FtsX-like permease family protein [Candidatus Acetothermia bacterium]